jgi:predicted DNA-binding protein (UPF0251 family)/predicted Fe-Mo cluster-binding NifX family protein
MNSRKKRYARRLDETRTFKPAGIPTRDLEIYVLGLDEFEALRLVDLEGKSQIEASEEMQVSRATIQRLLLKGRKKIVETILTNNALEVRNEIANIKLKGENNMDIESKEIKKIAFPTSDKSTIDVHFGKTKEFAIYTIKETEVIAVNHIMPPPHAPGVIPNFLAENDVDVVITGGMGAKAVKMFENAGIDVILGAKGRIDVNLNEYIGGFLSSKGSVCSSNHDHGHDKDHECKGGNCEGHN